MTSHELKPPLMIITKSKKDVKITTSFFMGCGGGSLVTVDDFLAGRFVESEKNTPILAAGILRGSGDCIKKSKEFWYMDHGYFNRTPNGMLAKCTGYYRVGYNTFWNSGEGDYSWDRFNSFGIKLRPWRKNGDHIVIVPPSRYMGPFLNRIWWLEKTKEELSKYTDRKLVVSTKPKSGGVPLSEALINAWALVTDHSNSAIDAMIKGIPAIMTHPDRKLGSLEEIENPPKSRNLLKNLAHRQWTIDEMWNGLAWEEIKTHHKSKGLCKW